MCDHKAKKLLIISIKERGQGELVKGTGQGDMHSVRNFQKIPGLAISLFHDKAIKIKLAFKKPITKTTHLI